MSSGIDPAILDALQAGPVYEVIPLPDAIGGGASSSSPWASWAGGCSTIL